MKDLLGGLLLIAGGVAVLGFVLYAVLLEDQQKTWCADHGYSQCIYMGAPYCKRLVNGTDQLLKVPKELR